MPGRFYLTTAIDYVNSAPHVGTSYEKILADVIARWKRLKGDDVSVDCAWRGRRLEPVTRRVHRRVSRPRRRRQVATGAKSRLRSCSQVPHVDRFGGLPVTSGAMNCHRFLTAVRLAEYAIIGRTHAVLGSCSRRRTA